MSQRRLLSSLFLMGVVILSASGRVASFQTTPQVITVPVSGVIELGLAPFVERSLREASDLGAHAVVLDLDTPGGRVDAAERIADAISDSDVPVYAYINRRAFSAGALISLATDRIYMRPGSVIGAATPVDGTGTKAPEKIVSAMRSEMRALAEAHGLDPAVAEAMVDEQIEIPGVVDEGKLLSLTTEEAVDLGFAVQIEDMDALLASIGAEGADLVSMRVNWAERIVRFLSHPVVSPFLLTLGFLGLLAEVKTPGFGVGGAAGLLALSLFFGSHLLVGLAGLESMIIFGAGLIFLGLEIFVVPGFGLFGLLGALGVLVGLFLAMVGGLPTMADFGRAGLVISSSMMAVVVTAWALLRRLPHSGPLARRGVFLMTRTDREAGFTSADMRPDLVGLEGVAVTDLRPSGVGLFGDERVDVVSESEWIEAGTPVRILSSEGYRHVVRATAEAVDPPLIEG